MIPHKKRRRLTIRAVLSIIVLFTAARAFMRGNYEHLFLCVLTLLLFCVPMVIDRTLGIDLPPVLETIIYCFIFSAEILGEINSYYTKIPYWDTMLHTIKRLFDGCHRVCPGGYLQPKRTVLGQAVPAVFGHRCLLFLDDRRRVVGIL